MTKEEAINELKIFSGTTRIRLSANFWTAHNMAIKALEQEPCEDAISREAALEINRWHHGEMSNELNHKIWEELKALPSAHSKPKTEHCKECKYFEYDSVAKVNGIPLIVAHEICFKMG